jgi:hypothetical protein
MNCGAFGDERAQHRTHEFGPDSIDKGVHVLSQFCQSAPLDEQTHGFGKSGGGGEKMLSRKRGLTSNASKNTVGPT